MTQPPVHEYKLAIEKRGAERDYIVLKLCCGADGSSTHMFVGALACTKRV